MRPGDSSRFVRETVIVGLGAEVKVQVVMQMIRLAFMRRYAMNVDADQVGGTCPQEDAGLFDNLAAGGFPEFMIVLGNVSTRHEPAIQLRVVDQQQSLAIGRKHETCSRDVAGGKLATRKRRRSMEEQKKRKLAAFDRGCVGGIVEGFEYLGSLLDGRQATMVA